MWVFKLFLKLISLFNILSSKIVWILMKFMISSFATKLKSHFVFNRIFFFLRLCSYALFYGCQSLLSRIVSLELGVQVKFPDIQNNMCCLVHLDWFRGGLVESVSLWWSDKRSCVNQNRVFSLDLLIWDEEVLVVNGGIGGGLGLDVIGNDEVRWRCKELAEEPKAATGSRSPE